MPALVRLERWSDRESNSGVRTGFLHARDAFEVFDYREVSGREELTLSIDPAHDWASTLTHRQVIRAVFGDSTYDEWRVWRLTHGRGKDNSRRFDVFCRSIKFDLGDEMAAFVEVTGREFLHHELGDIEPTDLLDKLISLPRWPADFTKGTVDAAGRYTFSLEWESHLSAVTEGAKVSGTELDVVRVGTTAYAVHLLTEVRAGETAEIRFAKNALESEVERDYTESGTLIYPKGEGPQGEAPTIADMRWLAVEGSPPPTASWTLYPWNGRGTAAADLVICTEDDQFNGLYLDTSLGWTEITDSTRGAGGLSVGITLASAVNDISRLHRLSPNSAGDDLTYIPVPSKVATYGRKAHILERLDIPGITNLVPEPFEYGVGGVDWYKLNGPVLTQIVAPSPLVVYGKTSMKVVAAAGEGIARRVVPPEPFTVDPLKPWLSFQVLGHLEAGAVAFTAEMVWEDDFGARSVYTFPNGTNEDGTPIEAVASIPGAPLYMSVEPQTFNFSFSDGIIAQVGSIVSLEMHLQAKVDGTIFYADAWQVVNSNVAGDKFVSGASAAKLWDAGCRAILNGVADPKARLRTTALDLTRLDSASYPYDAMHPGVTARIVDTGIGLDESRRIRSVRRDLKNEALTALELMEAEVFA